MAAVALMIEFVTGILVAVLSLDIKKKAFDCSNLENPQIGFAPQGVSNTQVILNKQTPTGQIK